MGFEANVLFHRRPQDHAPVGTGRVMAQVSVGGASHPGMRKSDNEDAYAVHVAKDSFGRTGDVLLVVADGMGGHAGGAKASALAVDIVLRYFREATGESVPDTLTAAFQKAHTAILEKSDADRTVAGMATTLTAAVIRDDRLFYAHVGDSRAYLADERKLTVLTADHSYVASLVRAGVITEDEADRHPRRNVVTRAVGIPSDLTVDTDRIPRSLSTGQRVLLCCDGLYKVVPEREIHRVVLSEAEPTAVCEALVETANAHGGPDNITAVLARIDGVGRWAGFRQWFRKPQGR